MERKIAQCFDCYSDATFQYTGQTPEWSEQKVQINYVAALTKPATVVECVTCSRTLKYTENNGFWETEILSY